MAAFYRTEWRMSANLSVAPNKELGHERGNNRGSPEYPSLAGRARGVFHVVLGHRLHRGVLETLRMT